MNHKHVLLLRTSGKTEEQKVAELEGDRCKYLKRSLSYYNDLSKPKLIGLCLC